MRFAHFICVHLRSSVVAFDFVVAFRLSFVPSVLFVAFGSFIRSLL